MNAITSLEVLTWRLGGAATWQAAIVSTLVYFLVALSPKFAPVDYTALLTAGAYGRTWLAICGVLAALVPANIGFVYLLSNDNAPIRYRKLVVLCLPVPLAGFLQNLLTRLLDQTAVLATLASISMHWASAWVILVQAKYLLSLNLTLVQAAWMGFVLALCYNAHLSYYSRDRLRFPTIQRHRYHRIKTQLPHAVLHAFALATIGLCIAVTTYPLVQNLNDGRIPCNVDVLVVAWLLVTCWIVATVCVETVFTERLAPGDYPEGDRLEVMNKCLRGELGFVMKLLALHDLSSFSAKENAWQRRELFADDTGHAWRLVSRPCMQILESVLLCADAVPGPGQEETSDKKWNALKLPKVGSLDIRMVEAIGRVSVDFEQVRCAIRSLCGILLASINEDRFGILQLDGAPNLGDVMLALLNAMLVTRRLVKFESLNRKVVAASIGRQVRVSGDFAFLGVPPTDSLRALQDELSLGLYRIVTTFGDGLIEAVGRTATTVPKYGSTTDCLGLLKDLYDSSNTLFQTS